MAQVLCYVPGERIMDSALWGQIRSWQKASSLSSDKIRVTADFLGAQSCDRQDLAGALNLVRGGEVNRVVFLEARVRAKKDLDWLAFACSCVERGIAIEDAEGQAMLSAEQAAGLAGLLKQAAKPKTK